LSGKVLTHQVNRDKSVVDRPWNGTFLGHTGTNNRQPRLTPAPKSINRAKDRMRQIPHRGRGRTIRGVIEESNRFTRGWVGDCRLSSVNMQFERVAQWRRRRWRKILWEPWRQPKTRGRKLIARGREVARARKTTATGLGAWWNARASHRHAAVNNRILAAWGLQRRLDQLRAMQRSTCTAVYGPARTVVGEDGRGNSPSHPIPAVGQTARQISLDTPLLCRP
jgi:RNA-directed DNA polymerase